MRVLRIADVINRTGLPRRTIYQEIRDGRFPRPVELTARCVGWPEAEVEAWLKAKVDARDKAVAA